MGVPNRLDSDTVSERTTHSLPLLLQIVERNPALHGHEDIEELHHPVGLIEHPTCPRQRVVTVRESDNLLDDFLVTP